MAHGLTRSGIGYSKPKIVPEEADLAKAADDLSAGNKVAILVGAGARGTASDLTEMARGRSESRGLDAACSAWQRDRRDCSGRSHHCSASLIEVAAASRTLPA